MKYTDKNLYFAPMEGIGTWVFRRVHHEMFGGCDEYWAPFITPTDNEKLSQKSLRDILPQHNEDIPLRVQVLTNSCEAFLKFEEKALGFGYSNININMGCPSGTVVKKGRGAGILQTPDIIDQLLANVCEKSHTRVSVKTRIGFSESCEIEELINIYNKYPICELTVHPRTRSEFYGGVPHYDVYEWLESAFQNSLCYNGNIFSAKDFGHMVNLFSKTDSFMIGRGAVANPAIFREIRGGSPLCTDELLEFSDRLIEKYLQVLGSEVYTLHKLKEIWMYFMWNFPDEKKLLKLVKKLNTLADLRCAAKLLPQI